VLALESLLKPPRAALAVLLLVVIRLIRPWYLVRIGRLMSERIGHFAANTEMYLCERDAGINVPEKRHVDLFYMTEPISNRQLATMWKRVLITWPRWILAPVLTLNRLIPGGDAHEIGNNTQGDRDVHNLLDRFPPHIAFTPEEEVRGKASLLAMGIAPETPFVCLNVRDNAYLDAAFRTHDWSYHSYRDCDVQNFVLAAEELANRGFFVVRMGARVRAAIKTSHPKVVDYATNGMRNDFMDIYLGAKCTFCISTCSGFDTVPMIFRRPVGYANLLPLGIFFTFSAKFLGITKHHFSRTKDRDLTLSEIFTCDAGFCISASDYESKDIRLIENTPEEIRDLAIEMAERLNGTWRPRQDDEALQCRFWEIFPADAKSPDGKPMHGEVRSRFGAAFLRNNQAWLHLARPGQLRPLGELRPTCPGAP